MQYIARNPDSIEPRPKLPIQRGLQLANSKDSKGA